MSKINNIMFLINKNFDLNRFKQFYSFWENKCGN